MYLNISTLLKCILKLLWVYLKFKTNKNLKIKFPNHFEGVLGFWGAEEEDSMWNLRKLYLDYRAKYGPDATETESALSTYKQSVQKIDSLKEMILKLYNIKLLFKLKIY